VQCSGARRDEHEAAAASLAVEEAAQKVDTDLVAMRAQLQVGLYVCMCACVCLCVVTMLVRSCCDS